LMIFLVFIFFSFGKWSECLLDLRSVKFTLLSVVYGIIYILSSVLYILN
jgi:hypothetical protein